jgi:hypothetical protein
LTAANFFFHHPGGADGRQIKFKPASSAGAESDIRGGHGVAAPPRGRSAALLPARNGARC